jgi:hypothetical protein
MSRALLRDHWVTALPRSLVGNNFKADFSRNLNLYRFRPESNAVVRVRHDAYVPRDVLQREIEPIPDNEQERLTPLQSHRSPTNLTNTFLERSPATLESATVHAKLREGPLANSIPFALDDDRGVGGVDRQDVNGKQPSAMTSGARDNLTAEHGPDFVFEKRLDLGLVCEWKSFDPPP